MTMTGWEFTTPGWLWLLPIIVLLWLGGRLMGRASEHGALASVSGYANLRFFHPLINLLPGSYRQARPTGWRTLIQLLIFACLVVSLAGPARVGQQLPDPPRERDIIFIVDTSVSMVLRDYVLDEQRIDRQTLLKGILGKFTEHLRGERLSLIVFGDQAYTLCPLTRDLTLVREMIARITTTMAGRNSAVGDAIALALKQAGERTGRQQILVLLTAASQSSGRLSPLTAATLAKRASLPLYTIAIGAGSTGAEEQRLTGLIYEPANLALLSQLAELTGARAYQAGDSQALQQAIRDIEQNAFNEGELTPRFYRESLYHWPLLLGLALLVSLQLGGLFRGRR